jgi:hypothetical protein
LRRWFEIDGDYVEAQFCFSRVGWEAAEIGAGEGAKSALLVGVDCHLGWAGIAACAGFDFYDAERGAVPADEVDVAAEPGGTPAASDDCVSVAAEMEEGFALAGGAGFEVGGVAGCSRERGEAAKRPGLRADPHATRGADSFGLAHALQLKRFWRKERFGENGGMCSVVERASNIARRGRATMTLLNAPNYDSGKEKRKTGLVLGGLGLILLAAVMGVGGYLLGHGWFFSNLPVEHKVDKFFDALEAKDYNQAYGLWMNDPDWQKHPEKYDYTLKRFTEDWTTESSVGPIKSHKVDISKTAGTGTFGTGIIVAVRVNGDHKMFLHYEKKDGTLTYSPLELEYN